MINFLPWLLSIFSLISSQYVIASSCANHQCRPPGDDRLSKTSLSPKYLDAVGRLRTTKTDGESNICGASLVGFTAKQDSRVLVTSLQCLKGKRMTWEAHTQNGKTIKRSPTETLDYSYESDYAILLLDKKVRYRDISPLIIVYELSLSPEEIIYDEEYGNPKLMFAGYSADAKIGKSGSILTYDTTGDISTSQNPNEPTGGWAEGITTYQGSSGGALIVTYTDYKINFPSTSSSHIECLSCVFIEWPW
ncbi:hypothetical protein [Vibrio sp. HN007]|uniref:hypothetical protein n=1 Tax=Vibrio iocasae TaxID=3098914 RepID=UPI0035D4AA11